MSYSYNQQCVIGIDGCPAGWVGVMMDDSSVFQEARVWTSAKDMIRAAREFRLALIDIPIGLPDRSPGRRTCDFRARELLGAKRASIFLPPLRQTLPATTYLHANALNQRACGKKISIQMWNLLPKIRAVDECLCREPHLQKKIRESHPEICFQALNQQQPVMSKKKTEMGRQQRLTLIAAHSENARTFYAGTVARYPRADLGHDDVIDAMVLALTATRGCHGRIVSLPETPEFDGRGLRMEIVYAEFVKRKGVMREDTQADTNK